ncbi:MAG: GAF domain-containing protein [Chloroflexota bacterium]
MNEAFATPSTIKAALETVFIQNAINNRGLLKSTRQSEAIAERLYRLVYEYVNEEIQEGDITAVASELAEQGLVIETAARLMQVLNDVSDRDDSLIPLRVSDFQVLFLEKLAHAHDLIEHSIREQSQIALQRALHSQLEQQQVLHQSQELYTEKLNAIIELNSYLSSIRDEGKLLHEAIHRVQQTLELDYVTIGRLDQTTQRWLTQRSTNKQHSPNQMLPSSLAGRLDQARVHGGEFHEQRSGDNGRSVAVLGIILGDIGAQTGAMIAQVDTELEGAPILLRAFAQALTALWRTAVLFGEMQERNRELEIMHGRYIDTLWHAQSGSVHASYGQDGLTINRGQEGIHRTQVYNAFGVQVGEQSFGQVYLPEQLDLTEEDREYVQDIINEMGSALNSARLLQSASANSNQLSVAAEVSRRVTTILDREVLIEQVVELVRERFGLYYVGIFLVEDEGRTAVLKSGTGEAGRIQIARNFQHDIGGPSMIGTAIARGEAIVEQDVTQAAAFKANPLLPLTKSELALPLRTGDRTIGALTAQHVELAAFPADTVTILQSLADQLAIAIENAGLFTQLEETLAELTATLRETSNLYDTSRRINESTTAKDVYQALIHFASLSKLADTASVITEDPTDADFLIMPVLWGSTQRPFNPRDRFPRERFRISELLDENRLIAIEDVWADRTLDDTTRNLLRHNAIRSITFLPIHTEDEWLGSLALGRTTAGKYSHQELQPFRTLADQAAVILSNQRLLEQTNALYTINNLLTKAVTRELALAEIVSQVANYVGLHQCRFVLFDKHTEQATVFAATAPDLIPDAARQFSIHGDYIHERLAHSRTPLLLELSNRSLPAPCKERHLQILGNQASYIIPAFSQQELLGYMALDSKRSKRPFSDKNVKFAQTVVEQATVQIENLKLYEDALHRAQDLIMLNQIGSTISGAIDLAALPQTVYEQVGLLLDFDLFIFADYNSENQQLTPTLAMENGRGLETSSHTLTSNEQLYQILHSDRPTLTKQETSDLTALFGSQLAKQPQSAIWVTLVQEGKPTGLITIQAEDPYIYTPNSAQLLRTIATQTSLSMINAQLFQTIQTNLSDIQEANKKLRELDELKTQFLANMSHELRTPLNSIIGFSRVILKGIDGPITDAQEEDLTTIYKNGQHLLALINEILDMAKIEAGKMTLAFEFIELSELARTVHAITRGLIKEGDIELIWNIASNLPKVEADPIRIRQILINLLSNAVKFTREGHIELQINQTIPDFVHIAVKDTGIGIAEEDYDKLFAAFEQVDSSTTRVAGGTGLGLPITNWLINMHGGSITVESKLNEGTTFHVQLPIKQNRRSNQNAFFSSPMSN